VKYPGIKEIQEDHGRGRHDFYRCYRCGTLFTREQERNVFDLASMSGEQAAAVCSCGSGKYSPSMPLWYEWLKPAVVSYAWKLLLARGAAPWCEKHLPEALESIEWAVRRG